VQQDLQVKEGQLVQLDLWEIQGRPVQQDLQEKEGQLAQLDLWEIQGRPA
jgi:hypothetical protein